MCSNNIRRKVWPEGKGMEEVGLEVKMGLPEESWSGRLIGSHGGKTLDRAVMQCPTLETRVGGSKGRRGRGFQ